MAVVSVHDPAAIEGCFRADRLLHLYEIGDLDPFFWPRTTWCGLPGVGDALLGFRIEAEYEEPEAS